MIEKFWSQHGPRTAWLIVLGLAAILGVQASLGLTSGQAIDERVDDVAKKLRPRPMPSASQPGGHGQSHPHAGHPGSGVESPASAATQRIQQRYLFMPAPPQGFRNVQGVLGDRVLYPGGRSFGLGENAMGATVVAIGSNWVELLHEGQTITLDIFQGGPRGPEVLRWEGETPSSTPNEEASPPRGQRGKAGESREGRRRGDRDRDQRSPGSKTPPV